MNKDAERVDQPEGTYRDALNANINDVKAAITNEQGTSRISTTNVQIVGQVALDDNTLVIFGIDQSSDLAGIFHVKPVEDTVTLILASTSLNFSVDRPIEATFKVSAEGDRLVYFTDNTYQETEEAAYTYVSNSNPPRVINIDRQIRTTQGVAFGVFLIYGNPDFGVEKLDVIPNVGVTARIDGVEITEGGGLITGAYHLGLAYLDEDFNETDFFILSNPVSIVAGSEQSFPIEAQIGDMRGTQTNKSIVWKVRVYKDCNYKYLQPAIVKVEGSGEGIEAIEAKKLAPIELYNKNEIINVVHTGIEQATAAAVEDITVTNPRYLSAKSIAQSGNRLYMANLTSRPDIGYQKFANAITVEAAKEGIEEFDNRVFDTYTLNVGYNAMINPNLNDGENYQTGGVTGGFNYDYITEVIKPIQENSARGYRDANRAFRKKSFRRGDVYALYISFILNDGTETMAYHIPGRAPIRIFENGPSSNFVLETAPLEDYASNPAIAKILPKEILSVVPSAKTYQIFDSTILDTDPNESNMGFWENENETYPDTEDFDVWTVDSEGNPVQTTDTLRGENVRHHKFPTNKNTDFSYVVTGIDHSVPNNYSESGVEGRVEFRDTARILGVKLKNIRIPKDILSEVQEYRIYYAKRREQDKLVVGSGIPVPGHPRYSAQITRDKDTATRLKNYTAFYMFGQPASLANANSAMTIQQPNWSNSVDAYYGSPVFKIHDFSMLRGEKNITNLTHIDIQYIVTCRHFRGGPHVYVSANDIDDNVGYDTLGWLHPDLNNTVDPNDEDAAVRAYVTSLMFANRYNSVASPNVDVGMSLGSGPHVRAQDILPRQGILALEPSSKTYLPGLRMLKDETNAGFAGAQYLFNNIGETSIALGLLSGLPTLTGFHPSGIDPEIFLDGISDEYTGNALAWHSKNKGYLNIYGNDNNFEDSNNYVLNDNKAYSHGKPNVYLVNMCSHKSNVYKPFDRQVLVWTGHSQKILSPDLEVGEVVPDDIGYEIQETSRETNFNYYTGSSSTDIYGGDTFICRFAVRTTSMETGFTWYRNFVSGTSVSIPFGLAQYASDLGETAGIQVSSYTTPEGFQNLVDGLNNTNNRSNQNHTPVSTLMSYICESDDNINFRHAFDVEAGIEAKDAKFFDYHTASSVIFEPPTTDLTFRDNLLYLDHYSALQDLKSPQPYPKDGTILNKFPTRIIRSTVGANTLFDGYRKFLPIDKKDIPQDSGEIWKLTEKQSVLYINTEKALFLTKGQEQFEVGANSVFIGSGNIFAVDPDKIVDADIGVAGTRSQFASIRVPDGYFFVSSEEKKVYLLGESLEPISSYGMEDWFLENIPFTLEDYGLNPTANYTSINLDAPTDKFGFTAGYDPNYKRIILTKNELDPTALFISAYGEGYIELNTTTGGYEYTAAGIAANYEEQYGKMSYDNSFFFTRGGWTISYLPSLKVWISRHSYIPKLYAFTNKDYYSFFDNKIWAHNDFSSPGEFYGTTYNFEFEFVDNEARASAKIFSTVRYMADVTTLEAHTNLNEKFTNPGFTSFYVYNTQQISGTPTDLNYLSNIRRADRVWHINEFRDMALQETSTDADLITGVVNVQDNFTTGVVVPSETQRMFTSEGVVNANYIDQNKQWYDQKRFVDNFLAVRLIASNTNKKLINLYAAGTKYRQSFR